MLDKLGLMSSEIKLRVLFPGQSGDHACRDSQIRVLGQVLREA